MRAFDGGIFDRAIHSFDLAIGPRAVRLRQAVPDFIGTVDHVEAHSLARSRWCSVPQLLSELNAIVRKNDLDLIEHRFEQVLEDLSGSSRVSFLKKLSHGELARAFSTAEEVKLALTVLPFGNINVEEAPSQDTDL